MKRFSKLALALLVAVVVTATVGGCRSSGSNSGSSGRVMPRIMEGSGGR